MKIIFRKKDERVIAGIRIQGIELEVIPVRHGTFKKKKHLVHKQQNNLRMHAIYMNKITSSGLPIVHD